MSKRNICLYLHVHQPWRVKQYTIFDAGHDPHYFNDETPQRDTNNRFIIDKVAEKSYLPTNEALLEMLEHHSEFKFSLSISGTILEQLEEFRPDVLDSFKRLTDTGRVEIVTETYHHSLSFFYSHQEFEHQVEMHREIVERIFGQTPKIFRNTELSYNNELAQWADRAGYEGIIAEGWDPILGLRSPNFPYTPPDTENITLLLKNYKLSDDVAFRFSNQGWEEWPLTADKYAHWIDAIPGDQPLLNLFMDYETFGEHQWADTGIFDFLRALPGKLLEDPNKGFMTLSEAAKLEPVGEVDMPYTVTWADTERDLSAWLGNSMQHQAISAIYELEDDILHANSEELTMNWRRLQTSDHFYYMCTKWFNDGDVHAYFSPYESPYEAFVAYMNAYQDLRGRVRKFLKERDES